MASRPDVPAQRQVEIVRVQRDLARSSDRDVVAVEEPLEIRVGFVEGDVQGQRAVSITMRTPGDDFELAAGFLFTEGLLQSPDQVVGIRHCGRGDAPTNTVRVDVRPGVSVELDRLQRNFYTTSSCGVCGKTSLEALATGARRLDFPGVPRVAAGIVGALPARLRERQQTFEATGGLHAAALFDPSGHLLELREDVGRHNAVDKLIGARFLAGALPARDALLFLSGRASFELLQKAVMARIPVICAVGAPSSLAVEAAEEFGVTLLGFVRDGRFNVYAGHERLVYA